MTTEQTEKLKAAIDNLYIAVHGLNAPADPKDHVDQMKLTLPEIIDSIKEGFINITGENPWK